MDVMPNVWGEGQLLAFSGVDGLTSWAEPFVLSTARRSGELLLRLPQELPIRFGGLRDVCWKMLLGDVVVGEACGQGTYRGVFADHHTWLGEVPAGVAVQVGDATLRPEPCRIAHVGDLDILAWQSDRFWGLAVRGPHDGGLLPPATEMALTRWVEERSAFVRGVDLAETLPPERVRLLRKAVSVMKVNIHSANGTIGRRWSTPDRWPHRHMWLWDSAFHAVGMAPVSAPIAQDEVLAMLEQITADGMLPHMVQADGGHSAITQPPLLAWAALQVLEHGADLDWARQCVPLLRRYLDWDRAHRDRNGNGLPEWQIEGNPLCRCGESGLDNSSVYDRAVLLDAPDFAAFLFNDYECLAEIADRVGDPALAEQCHRAADPIAAATNRELWGEEEGLYFHRDHQGVRVPVKAVSGFMPLFAGIPDDTRVARLAAHLRNPATFGAPALVPSESLDSGTFCKDMWRGPAWMNLSYLMVLGLRRYGLCADAEALKENLLDTMGRWYAQEGCLFEYYDSLGLTSPRGLDRKQRLISGKGIAPICDYHWTAAVAAALLLE